MQISKESVASLSHFSINFASRNKRDESDRQLSSLYILAGNFQTVIMVPSNFVKLKPLKTSL